MSTLAEALRKKSKADRKFTEGVDQLLGSMTSRVRLQTYQREGLHDFILKRERNLQGGILGDEMGLGKTYSMAAAIKCNPMGRTLILVPCSVLGQWEAALAVFNITVVTVNNADTSFPQAGLSDNIRVFLATHSCLVKRKMHAFFCSPWDRIVVDEAHVLRNPGALMNTNAMALTSRIRWALTATPIQNQIEDITSLARFVGAPNPDDALDVCNNHMMRRTAKKLEERYPALKLPPLTCRYEVVDLSVQERAVYTSISKKYKRSPMSCILRQRQACVHAGVAVSPITGKKRKASEIGSLQNLVSTKIKFVLDDLNKQPKATKTLIFSTWTLEIDLIRTTLMKHGYGVLVFDGSLDAGKREAVLNNFKLPGFNVLILQITCGSVGLNLQHATRVYIMSPGWNPTTEMQAIARTHRQGQTQRVTCVRLVAKGTVEETVVYTQQRKSKLIDQATNDNTVASRMLLTDMDLGFLADGKGVSGLEALIEENGGTRRPALSLEPKKKRKPSKDTSDDDSEAVEAEEEEEEDAHASLRPTPSAAAATNTAPTSTTWARTDTSAAIHATGASSGSSPTITAPALTSSATLDTSLATAPTTDTVDRVLTPSARRKASPPPPPSTPEAAAGPSQTAGSSRMGVHQAVVKEKRRIVTTPKLRKKADNALARAIQLGLVF